MANIKFFALGGLDENGKNSYALEINDDVFIINYGNKIPVSSTNGIDTIIADFSYISENIDRIRGVFISDVTNENFSALPWLIMNVKGLQIYSSAFSNFLIKDRLFKYNLGHTNFKLNILNLKGQKIGNTFVKAILCAGALPGTLGFQFDTEDGSIIFMSNLVNGNLGMFGNTRLDLIKNGTKKILALICDSGMANYNGRTIENIDIEKSLNSIFKSATPKQRIIVGVYDNELASSYKVLELALKHNRNVITYGKTFHQLIELIKSANKNIEFPKILDYKNIEKEENCVVIISGSVERLYNRFIRISENNDVYLKIREDDRVIMIAPPVNGLETQSTFMLDELARITPFISDFSSLDHYRYRPAKQDIVDIVSALKPKFFIPIQGLYRYMIVAKNEIVKNNLLTNDKVLILKNGKVARFKNSELIPKSETLPHIGEIIIDGFGIGDISKEVIFERELIAKDGVVIASILTNKKKEIYSDITFKYLGVIPSDQREELDDHLKNVIVSAFYDSEDFSQKFLQNKFKKLIKKQIFKLKNKEPLVVVLISEI